MKKIALGLIIFMSLTTSLKAQTGKSVYVELGGAGLASFNYDTRFSKKPDGLGARFGLGGVMIDGDGAMYVPVGLNYLTGKDGKNFFEIGAGITFVNSSSPSEDLFNTTFGNFNVGYRYQPKSDGFLFRANICPVFSKNNYFPFWAGISFGYKF